MQLTEVIFREIGVVDGDGDGEGVKLTPGSSTTAIDSGSC